MSSSENTLPDSDRTFQCESGHTKINIPCFTFSAGASLGMLAFREGVWAFKQPMRQKPWLIIRFTSPSLLCFKEYPLRYYFDCSLASSRSLATYRTCSQPFLPELRIKRSPKLRLGFAMLDIWVRVVRRCVWKAIWIAAVKWDAPETEGEKWSFSKDWNFSSLSSRWAQLLSKSLFYKDLQW